MVEFRKDINKLRRVLAGKQEFDAAPLLVTGDTYDTNASWEEKLRTNDLKYFYEFLNAQTINRKLRIL